MPDKADTYDALLHDFEQLLVEQDGRYFELKWVTPAGCRIRGSLASGDGEIIEWLDPDFESFDLKQWTVLTTLALPLTAGSAEYTLGWEVLLIPRAIAQSPLGVRFKECAKVAGAKLPIELKAQLKHYVPDFNSNAAAWWYALLFQRLGAKIWSGEGEQRHAESEIYLPNPILYSTEAVNYVQTLLQSSAEAKEVIAGQTGSSTAGTDAPPRFVNLQNLMKELGVIESRKSAFEKMMSRRREKLPDGSWKEVEFRKQNESQYLYDLTCPMIKKWAEAYKKDKAV
ncbi:MAG: hypothetical protein RH917_06190 [Lacipirellulaceae bacterium]